MKKLILLVLILAFSAPVMATDFSSSDQIYGWNGTSQFWQTWADHKTQLSLVYEEDLGNPPTDGYVLSSTAAGVRSWIAPASGGSTSFLNLTDTPSSYTANYWVKVNSGGTALELAAAPTGTGDMLAANNLSDVVSASTSRTNLGLGTAAVLDTGTAIGDVVQVDDVGYCSDTQYTDQTTCETNSGTWTAVAGLKLTVVDLPTAAGYKINGADMTAADIGGQPEDTDLTIYAGITPSANTQSFLGAADYATMRSLMGVDAAGTDNSTNVTLSGTPDYLTITGQTITRNQIDLTTDVTGLLPDANIAATIARDSELPVSGVDFNAYSATMDTDSTDDVTLIASGTASLGTAAIAVGACATVVSATATGTATTDVVDWGFNADPTAVGGYDPSGDLLYIVAYPTANNVNFKVCNKSGSSITPGAITLNWKVQR